MTDARILWVKAALAFLLVGICGLMLFVPTVEAATEVRGMFVLLAGIAVRDFFGATQEDKRVKELKQAYDPAPPSPHVFGDEES